MRVRTTRFRDGGRAGRDFTFQQQKKADDPYRGRRPDPASRKVIPNGPEGHYWKTMN